MWSSKINVTLLNVVIKREGGVNDEILFFGLKDGLDDGSIYLFGEFSK